MKCFKLTPNEIRELSDTEYIEYAANALIYEEQLKNIITESVNRAIVASFSKEN